MLKSRFGTSASRLRIGRAGVGALVLALGCAVLASCDADPSPAAGEPTTAASGPGAETPELRIRSNVGRDQAAVPVDHMLALSAEGGRLRKVEVTSEAGLLPGRLSGDGAGWTATGRLEPGLDYQVRSVALRSDGERVTRQSRFHTEDLTLDQQTYASVAPLAGETVGVGMPVIVTFDVPVTDRATIERHMTVTSTPRQVGSWHWLSDQEVHWRPKAYWQAGSQVAVDVDINSVPAGAGIYGQESRHVEFSVGDANVYKVDARTHQMRVFQNGTLLRTLPTTVGKPGFTTRSGVKVIIEKFREKRMNSETVGIERDDPEAYDIDDVEYAMRVTYTGEFVHAAPWSVGSQGHANVSHGCTGLSTADAGWLYDLSKRGDVVEYTGTDRPMTLTNGYGDWNTTFADWSSGSALHRPTR